MFGVAPRSSRTSLKVPFSSGLSANTRHTSPPLMTGMSLPYRAVNASTACPAVEMPGGGATGGMVAIDGWTMVGWVSGDGRVGPEPAPEGGARLSAGPEGASGTEAGGIGGGRSLNNWADAKSGSRAIKIAASAITGRSRLPRPRPPMPLPHEVIAMLFNENAANSSLGGGPEALIPIWNRSIKPMLVLASWSSHNSCLGRAGWT